MPGGGDFGPYEAFHPQVRHACSIFLVPDPLYISLCRLVLRDAAGASQPVGAEPNAAVAGPRDAEVDIDLCGLGVWTDRNRSGYTFMLCSWPERTSCSEWICSPCQWLQPVLFPLRGSQDALTQFGSPLVQPLYALPQGVAHEGPVSGRTVSLCASHDLVVLSIPSAPYPSASCATQQVQSWPYRVCSPPRTHYDPLAVAKNHLPAVCRVPGG